ncbi:MAG: hypothetical protein GEU71_13285 [Actinobacteria bacterium]|nr:hypothetical protein [Actinomycetota bacterium]
MLFNIITFLWLSPFEERLDLARLIIVLAPAYAVVTFFLAARTDDSIEKGDIRRIMTLSLISTVSDALLIAVWIYATGGPASPYFLLYHASVAASVGRFGLAMGVVSTVASALAYIAVVMIDGGAPVYPIVVRVGYMFVIAAFSGYLVEIVRRSERDAARSEAAAKSYKEVDELKSAFVQNISHELRTPLTVIRGASSTLLRRHEDLDEAQRGALLEMVEKHSAHFGRLIQDLLDFATTTRGELTVSGTRSDLTDLVRSEADRIQPNITQRIVISSPGESIPLWCDEAKVKRAIHALLDNASKFSDPGSEIDVVSELRAGVAVLKVIDRGVGIPEEFHDQIFESFFQINPAPEGDVAGTGIGLHVAREMIRLHGGDVVVSSAPGVGTTFTVLIPVEPPREEALTDSPSA